MKKLNFTAEKNYKKLYYFLKSQNFSESLISALRKTDNNMFVNFEKANMRSPIFEGDKIELCFADLQSTDVPLCDLPLDILFENEDILVVNKPSGIATIPSKSHFSLNLAGAVKKYMQKRSEPFVFRAIGRLDKETSGIVVIALNQWACENTKVEKKYIALCHGHFDTKKFVVDKPIATQSHDGINERKRQISSNGKPAQTFVEVIENKGEFSLVSLNLLHGKTHQIRVHLSSILHPICGDKLYGKADEFPFLMLGCNQAKITLPDGKEIKVEANNLNNFHSFKF